MSALPDIAVEASSGRVEFVRARLQSLSREAGNIIMENALLLREIKDNAYYRRWGFQAFDECIHKLQESGEIDYGPRQARNFLAIADMIDTLQLPADAMNTLGVSKLREIAALDSPDAQRSMLETAKDMTVRDVQRACKASRDKAAGRDVDPLNPITIMATDTQRQFFNDCIERARFEYALDTAVPVVAVLIDSIMADWMSGLPQLDTHTDAV